MKYKALSLITLALCSINNAYADNCAKVTFADVGWTDITSTTAIASQLLNGLGYTTDTELLSVPVTYSSMASGDVDVFLGNWMPTMKGDIAKYTQAGTVETVQTNLVGAKYTLAVPKYVYDAGVHSFADLAKFADKFKHRIYGIEPGNDGNRLIQSMIDKNAFNLKDFDLVESSEAGMVSQVTRAIRRHQWIAYLGWAPHPMNSKFDMKYLAGGDDYFGPNYGGATVMTNVRKGYLQQCPNVGKLITNLKFDLDMENHMMARILNDNQKPATAAREWLQSHEQYLDKWLKGVKTIDDKPGKAAVMAYLSNAKDNA